MKKHAFALTAAAISVVAVAGCNRDRNANGVPAAQTGKAQKIAGTKTIAAGLAPASRFMAAAKASGLDGTLAGPGPYTVLVPDDSAFNAAPAGLFDQNPKNRAQVTGVLTSLILSGTVLAADIGKAIDHGKGKAFLATVGGGALTATRDGGKIVLNDAAGHKATITQADEQFTNGVVHHLDGLLMPAKSASGAMVGQKAGQ